MMADLPLERLGCRQPPFANCEVDYFGPLQVATRRSSEKRWGLLFTSVTTRAFHLEVIPSMDASSCVTELESLIAIGERLPSSGRTMVRSSLARPKSGVHRELEIPSTRSARS